MHIHRLSPWRCFLAAAASTALSLSAHASISPPPDYGMNFTTIGAPGNAPTTNFWVGRPFGQVNYEYRIAQTKVTNTQWIEFVQAYAPYYTWNPQSTNTGFIGGWIDYTPSTGYTLQAQFARLAAEPSFQMQLRYVNWLHNDKAAHRAAFESGAYDLSTFTLNPDGSRNDQLTRSPGARYWIPSLDEWVKGAYYDPHRFGQNQPGYWNFPYASDAPPIPGEPGIGTTNAGSATQAQGDLGLYFNATAPWGMRDVSGGGSEVTETVLTHFAGTLFRRDRVAMGTDYASDQYTLLDNRDLAGFFFMDGADTTFGTHAFRIASLVPSPSAGCVFIALLAFRRRAGRR